MRKKNNKPRTGAKQGIPENPTNPSPTGPVRKIQASYRSVTGQLWSKKNQRHVGYESFGEKRLFLNLEMNPLVLHYCEQPCSISYTDGEGIEHVYTPDVLVTYDPKLCSFPPVLAEFKYSKELLEAEKWKCLLPKLQAGLEYAKAKGYDFSLWTEQDLHPDHHRHASALRTLMRGSVDPALEAFVLGRLQYLGATTVGTLVAALKEEATPEAVTRVIWGLVASARIHADLIPTPHPGTRIWSVVAGDAHV